VNGTTQHAHNLDTFRLHDRDFLPHRVEGGVIWRDVVEMDGLVVVEMECRDDEMCGEGC
jgi:hypothetical protein